MGGFCVVCCWFFGLWLLGVFLCGCEGVFVLFRGWCFSFFLVIGKS